MDLVIWLREKNMHDAPMLQIDNIAQNSGLNYLNPGIKLMVGMVSLCLSITVKSYYLIGFIMAVMFFLTVRIGNVKCHTYFHLLLLPSIFILLSSIAILVQVSDSPLGFLDLDLGITILSITRKSLLNTIESLCRAYGGISCLYMMSLSTPLSEIIFVLRRIKMPKLIIELMYLIYRYITILLNVQREMHYSAQSRQGYDTIKSTYRSISGIASSLLLISFRKASLSYDAMISRGYEGELSFWQEKKPIHKREVCLTMGYFFVLFMIYLGEKL